jgi:hypothetical protein
VILEKVVVVPSLQHNIIGLVHEGPEGGERGSPTVSPLPNQAPASEPSSPIDKEERRA